MGTTKPANRALSVPSSEDVLVIPPALRRHVIPRRDGCVQRPVVIDPLAVAGVAAALDSCRSEIQAAADNRRTDPLLADAARSYLAGTATPLGAALAGLVAISPRSAALVDHWIDTYGLPFAASAVVEIRAVQVSLGQLYRSDPAFHDASYWMSISGRIREHLAVASDADYAATVDSLAGYRDTRFRRTAVSFLVPGRTEWVEADCAEFGGIDDTDSHVLMCAAGTAAQAEITGGSACSLMYTVTIVATGLDGAGAGMVPVLATLLDRSHGVEYEKLALRGLIPIPTDQAMWELIVRLDRRHVRPALERAARLFPVRATWLLASAAVHPQFGVAAIATDCLRAHVAAIPHAAEVALGRLDGARHDLIADMLADLALRA